MNLRFPTTLVAAGCLLGSLAQAQYAERPDLAGSGKPGVDVSGRSIKDKRVRAIHTTDPTKLGGTAYLFLKDPYLAYQMGRDMNFREFRERDGTFDAQVSNLFAKVADGTTAKITANNQTSCVGCHNQPEGTPGGGANFSKDSGFGRNSPHYFGAGLVEMLSIQTRTKILWLIDGNGDGWVSAAEAQAAGTQCVVRPAPNAALIDFGNPRLSGGTTGTPGFNNIIRVWYVDQNGKVVAGAKQVDGVTTFGYNFEIVIWGWGHGKGRSALNPTNRAFLWDPYKAHGGLEAYDPSTDNDPDGDGASLPTLAGAIQFPATHRAPDKGTTLDPLGFSTADPDQDGHLNEISEGDLDVAEWFMLNAPRPAFAGTQAEYDAGVAAMARVGCTTCHVPDWKIESKSGPRDAGPAFEGDRRLFDLDVTWNPRSGKLRGRVVPLYTMVGDSYVRKNGAFLVKGIFSDLMHHDMGSEFAEIDFGGTSNVHWRTPPLWGVGSGFPWGHDGRSLSIDDAIARHGGEGAMARAAYFRAAQPVRAAIDNLLEKLVLYDIESLPADIDGDGQVADRFTVAGMDTGLERFNAEWLFKVPLQIQGPFQNTQGETITSYCGVNISQAYGQTLTLRSDADDDGWPDVWDNAPTVKGYKNGVQ